MAETAKALYERLAIEREVYIDRAEDCAKYTIPFLFPKKEANGTTTVSYTHLTLPTILLV